MWPAVMFAASRKERVIGRTKILILSIKTRNGLSQSGAPPGKSLAAQDVGACVALERISESHKINPRGRVIMRCLESLNT